MRRYWKHLGYLLGMLLLLAMVTGNGGLYRTVTSTLQVEKGKTVTFETEVDLLEVDVEEDGCYTSMEEVAAYLMWFEHLPDNYITKKEAKKLGWVSSEGNLGKVAPGKSIGGDYFGNYEEVLPVVKGRDYYECDIDADGGYRGAKRIIFSDDGMIFYTEDHYKSFVELYPDAGNVYR